MVTIGHIMVMMIIYDDRPIYNSALKGFVMAISMYTIHATKLGTKYVSAIKGIE